MTTAIVTWLCLTSLIAGMAWLAIWSRRPTRLRAAAVSMFLAALPVSAVAVGVNLSWPAPMFGGINAIPGTWTVIGSKIVANEGIYILVDPGRGAPRYYSLPWDNNLAKQLQDILNREERPMVKVPPFEKSWDKNAKQFLPAPQPKWMPDKPRPEKPRRHERGA